MNEKLKWSFIGVLLGLGSPLGWLIIRFFLNPQYPTFTDWVLRELQDQSVLYLYETLGTVLSFGIFGYVAGSLLERLKQKSHQLEVKTQDYMKIVEFVAHELRTPLTSVKGRIDLALHDIYGPMELRLQDALKKAGRGCDQISHMISSYLNLARIERGELMVRKGKLHLLTEVLLPLAEEMKGPLEFQGMSLQWDGFENTNPIVLGDAQWLKVAFRNLLSNAVRYGYPGTCVKIRLQDMASEWRMEIYDQGIGVPENYLERIFQKFEKVPQEAPSGEKGIGLGLYIVREIVQQHDGRIWCESLVKEWTKMIVQLPKFSEERRKK